MALTGAIPFYSPKMKLLQEKTVKIGDTEYPIKMSTRAMINYEALSGHSISTIQSLSDITILFYCTVKAGGSELTYEGFMDLIDDKPESLTAFSDLMIEPTEKKKAVR
jgi:hypothetical protein